MSTAPASRDLGPVMNVGASKPDIPDYELARIVGRGSYGDVWLGRSVTGVWRAIKVVWRERFTTAEPFEREFRGLKEFADVSTGDSSQMALLHVGRNDAAGFFFSVMELADDVDRGRNIDPVSYVPLTLAEMRTRRGRIPAGECARFGIELARGLASLHRRGLVHRDIKPSNVIFVGGVAKLADIGLVAPSGNASTFVGTEGYVPPEGPGAPSADVFALAKVLYEASTGRDRQEFPKLPDDLGRLPDRAALLELNEIFLHACGPSPAERYHNGGAMFADLEALRIGASLRSRRLNVFLLRVAVPAFALGGAFWLWRAQENRPAAKASEAPIAAGSVAIAPPAQTFPAAAVGPLGEISPHSIAVLPFTNLTGDPHQNYLCDGISDEILNALARERDLLVSGATSSFGFKSHSFSTAQIANALRVAQLVEGSVQRSGSQLRINVRLVRTSDGLTEMLDTFTRESAELAGLQDEVARAVAAKLTIRRTANASVSVPTKNSEAYDAYLRGRALQVRDSLKADEAAKHYERAVELDPNFAAAWARLAEVRFRRLGDNTAKASAYAAVERAISVHPDLPLAWTVRGFLRGTVDHNFEAGRSDLARAEELGGRTAEWRMYRLLIAYLSGETKGVLALAREAAATNAELPPQWDLLLLSIFEYFGEFAEADRLYQRTAMMTGPMASGAFGARVLLRRKWRGAEAALHLLDRTPSQLQGLHVLRAQLLLDLGRTSEARIELERRANEPYIWCLLYADAGLSDRAQSLAEGGQRYADTEFERRKQAGSRPARHGWMRGIWISAEIVLGRRDSAAAELESWRQDLEEISQGYQRWAGEGARITEFYARLGQHDVAKSRLEQAIAHGNSMGFELHESISYVSLRTDPRFQAIVKLSIARAMMQPDPVDDWATGAGR
jgi:TolB-like protein